MINMQVNADKQVHKATGRTGQRSTYPGLLFGNTCYFALNRLTAMRPISGSHATCMWGHETLMWVSDRLSQNDWKPTSGLHF